MFKICRPGLTGVVVAAIAPAALAQQTISVPASSNPWFADAPDGILSVSFGETDRAPDQSPVSIDIFGDPDSLEFSAIGDASNGPAWERVSADGRLDRIKGHHTGVYGGLSDLMAPLASLIAVFVVDDNPETRQPGASLRFESGFERDFLALSPSLNQVFFIGDGMTSTGEVQQFNVPDGATRLILGVMDAYGWANNPGGFDVTVVQNIPGPSGLAVSGLAMAGLIGRRRR